LIINFFFALIDSVYYSKAAKVHAQIILVHLVYRTKCNIDTHTVIN
jgi:hypothetical protein